MHLPFLAKKSFTGYFVFCLLPASYGTRAYLYVHDTTTPPHSTLFHRDMKPNNGVIIDLPPAGPAIGRGAPCGSRRVPLAGG